MMDEEGNFEVEQLKASCNICGENKFDLREGFYYCSECGTKLEQVQEIQHDEENKFHDAKHIRGIKIKSEKIKKTNLTSWECYNYILRGLVEELMQLGAKEEIKLITLQLWAAYLRRQEVAFFNAKHAQLPKLGASFHKRDAEILYNHAAEKPRKRKRTSSSRASGDSYRDWRYQKRKLAESLYSASSAEKSESRISSSTGTTEHAIKINLSSHARKVLKKQMPANHIKKHESITCGILRCHSFPAKKGSLTRTELFVESTSIRDMYTILAIALNLSEDEIQLSDLVRFIAEGHIGTQNVLKYFPENVAIHGKEILRDIRFYLYTEKSSYRSLTENIQLMSKFIGIQEYRTPNLITLAKRYITELNLPTELGNYVESLINFLPPQMNMRSSKIYPAFEARAMAFVVFILKLLFGLDGFKEKEISESAIKLNEELEKSSVQSRNELSKLFVWKDWMEYVEMRKIIIAQFNSAFGKQFKVNQTISQKLEELKEFNQRDNTPIDEIREYSSGLEKSINNLHAVMEKYQHATEPADAKNVEAITFQASLVPSDSYFKRIRLQASLSKININIPEFMHIDHSLRTLDPYLYPKSLKQLFKGLNKNLNVKTLPCTNNKNYMGIFVSGREFISNTSKEKLTYKADFVISKKEWLSKIVDEPFVDEVTFKKKLDCYEKQYMKKLEAKALKRECQQLDDEQLAKIPTTQHILNTIVKKEYDRPNFDLLSLNSLDIFSENNMEPNEALILDNPRRDIDSFCLFDQEFTKDIEDSINSVSSMSEQEDDLTLLISELDCWLLIGHIADLSDIKKKTLENVFPRSFFWLLQTCANVINVDWSVLYDQLMAIEVTYGFGIQSIDDFKNCVRFKHLNRIKDINILVNWYREIW